MVQEEAHGEVVAAGGAPREKKLNFFQRIALFIRQVFAELRKVVWPTQQQLVMERFFDASGGTQLIIHSPYGSRLNRAWGLALRKRFCRTFNFELQAAATEEQGGQPAAALFAGEDEFCQRAGDKAEEQKAEESHDVSFV